MRTVNTTILPSGEKEADRSSIGVNRNGAAGLDPWDAGPASAGDIRHSAIANPNRLAATPAYPLRFQMLDFVTPAGARRVRLKGERFGRTTEIRTKLHRRSRAHRSARARQQCGLGAMDGASCDRALGVGRRRPAQGGL